MPLTVGELVARFDVDATGAERGIAEAELAMAGLQRDVDGTLRDLRGDVVDQSEAIGRVIGANIRSGMEENLAALHPEFAVDADTRPADAAVADLFDRMRALGEAEIGVDLSADEARRQLDDLMGRLSSLAHHTTDVEVRTRAADALFGLSLIRDRAEELDRMHPVVEVDVDTDAAREHLATVAEAVDHVDEDHHVDRVGRDFSRLTERAKGAAGALLGVALGGARMAATFGAAVPLAAGLVGMLVQLAPAAAVGATAILGVALAVGTMKLGLSGVSDAVKLAFDPSKADQFQQALKGLAPAARETVLQIRAFGPAFKSMKLDVQQTMFKGWAGAVRDAGQSILPVLRRNLVDTAGALNLMGRGVLDTATSLADSGVLGKALHSASAGVRNLAGAPGIVVGALGQLAAAAGPSFEKLTAAAGGALGKLSEKLNKAFESGGMQKAIEMAISQFGKLFDVIGNIGRIVGSVFSAADSVGGSFLDTAKKISGALADAFASGPVQSGLRALFQTMSVLASTAAPLLAQALGVIAPVIGALAPGVQTLVAALGAALQPVIAALGPVLLSAAQAVTQLIMAASPLLPVAGALVAQIGPILTPILNALAVVFQRLAPVIAQVAQMIGATLGPILAQVPSLLQPFLDLAVELAGMALPLLVQLLTALQPSLTKVTGAFVEATAALAPVLTQLVQLAVQCLRPLLPLLPPIIGFVGQLAAILANELARYIQAVVVPALKSVSALLNGDFKGAFRNAMEASKGFAVELLRIFVRLPWDILVAIGSLGNTLVSIGGDLISGLIRGIKNKLGDLKNTLSGITSMIPDWKGPPGRDRTLLTPAGRSIMDGLMGGIDARVPALRGQLQGLTGEIGRMVVGGRTPFGGPALAAAGAGGGFHIDNYWESPNGNPRATAEELAWMAKGRG